MQKFNKPANVYSRCHNKAKWEGIGEGWEYSVLGGRKISTTPTGIAASTTQRNVNFDNTEFGGNGVAVSSLYGGHFQQNNRIETWFARAFKV